MLTKNQIKHLRSLRLKKNRYAHRQFLVEGETMVSELLGSPDSTQLVLCTARYQSSLSAPLIERMGDKLIVCDASELRSISSLDAPSDVLALLNMPAEPTELLPINGLGLYLDGIRDPGNLGTIIRVADWFGLDSISMAADCVDVYNPKTIQASMGSFFRVRLRVTTVTSIQAVQPNLALLVTAIDQGEDALTFKWPANALLIIGNESRGVRDEPSSSGAQSLTIPRGPQRMGAESLNAAVATGILAAAYTRSCS